MKEEFFDVVIVGGGFGGLYTAMNLRSFKGKILLIDKTNHHLFQPLLYQVATAALSPADIATPIREILSKNKNTNVVMDEVINVEKDQSYLETKSGKKYSYAHLIIATGGRHSYFGNDQWENLAPGLKTIDDALTIREKMLKTFESAENTESLSKVMKDLTYVIIGAGPTGVEMAGAIAEIAKKTMFKDFSRIDTLKTQIYLIEGGDRVLPAFDPTLSEKAQKDLEELGVKVITDAFVTEVSEDGIKFGDEFIPCSNIIWAAGNKASPLLKTLNTELDKMGRAIVGKTLNIKDSTNIFVIGDAAAFEQNGRYLPGLAPVAMQQGAYLAKRILTKVDKPFSYFDKGIMATIGKSRAIAQVQHLKFSGFIAWFAWSFIHLMFLVLFRNRLAIFLSWSWNYFFEVRGARLIRK